MKKCSKCNIEKELNLFSVASKNKDKKRSQCKGCDKAQKENISTEKLSKYKKEYYIKNKEKLLKHNKEYSIINSVIISERKKLNRNPEKIKIKSREYYIKNKSLINEKTKLYQQKNKSVLRNKSRLRNIERRKNDSVFKLKCNIRRLIQLSFISKDYIKDSKTFEILGCNVIKFKKYLENKFEPWMAWENKGLFNSTFNFGWDLDHIKPLKTALTKDEVIKLNHYTNFQPLCGKINREIKNGKY